MSDTSIILAGMHGRLRQLRHIVDIAQNPEIKDAVLKVAANLEAEIERLEAESNSNVIELRPRKQA
jgi:hypothetical protein